MWKNQENTHIKKVIQKNRERLIIKKFSKINTKKKSGKYRFYKKFSTRTLAYGWCTAGLVPIPRVTKECLRRSSSRQSRNVMGIERAPSALSRNHVLARATYIRNSRAGPSFKTHCVGAWLGATAWGQLIWCSTSRITAGSDEDIVLEVV